MEAPEARLEAPEAWLEAPEAWIVGGRTDVRTDGCTDGRTDVRTNSPCSIGHRPLRGRCPKRKDLVGTESKESREMRNDRNEDKRIRGKENL